MKLLFVRSIEPIAAVFVVVVLYFPTNVNGETMKEWFRDRCIEDYDKWELKTRHIGRKEDVKNMMAAEEKAEEGALRSKCLQAPKVVPYTSSEECLKVFKHIRKLIRKQLTAGFLAQAAAHIKEKVHDSSKKSNPPQHACEKIFRNKELENMIKAIEENPSAIVNRIVITTTPVPKLTETAEGIEGAVTILVNYLKSLDVAQTKGMFEGRPNAAKFQTLKDNLDQGQPFQLADLGQVTPANAVAFLKSLLEGLMEPLINPYANRLLWFNKQVQSSDRNEDSKNHQIAEFFKVRLRHTKAFELVKQISSAMQQILQKQASVPKGPRRITALMMATALSPSITGQTLGTENAVLGLDLFARLFSNYEAVMKILAEAENTDEEEETRQLERISQQAKQPRHRSFRL